MKDETRNLARRKVLAGTAWAVPLIATAIATPMASASTFVFASVRREWSDVTGGGYLAVTSPAITESYPESDVTVTLLDPNNRALSIERVEVYDWGDGRVIWGVAFNLGASPFPNTVTLQVSAPSHVSNTFVLPVGVFDD